MTKEQAWRIMESYIKKHMRNKLNIISCKEHSNGSFDFICKSNDYNDIEAKEYENYAFVVFENGEADCLPPPT